mgnify:CR=1 FL=1
MLIFDRGDDWESLGGEKFFGRFDFIHHVIETVAVLLQEERALFCLKTEVLTHVASVNKGEGSHVRKRKKFFYAIGEAFEVNGLMERRHSG